MQMQFKHDLIDWASVSSLAALPAAHSPQIYAKAAQNANEVFERIASLAPSTCTFPSLLIDVNCKAHFASSLAPTEAPLQTIAISSKVTALIEAATHPEAMAQVDPTFLPWF